MMQAALECDQKVIARLTWRRTSGELESRELYDGETLTLGTDSGVDGADVSGRHCMIWAEGERITIRDCYSASGTCVDGRRISETTVERDAEIRIGQCAVTLALTGGSPSPSEASRDDRFGFGGTDSGDRPTASLNAETNAPSSSNPPFSSPPLTVPDPFQEEMLELLRAEVLELQAALAERQGTAGHPVAAPRDDDDSLPSREEVERLADRLEQLLEELGTRDQQVSLLEDLLLTAEGAAQAEQEERTQLENWVDEIEGRISQRELEWEAECDRQNARVAELTEERDRLATALVANESNDRLHALQQLNDGLRAEIERLKSALQDSEQHRAEVASHLEDLRIATRQEAVQLSRERAELARLRHDLESRTRESSPTVKPTEADDRLRAVQQDLRELHRQQKQEQVDRSLATRLGRLWKRLEGR